MKYRFELLLAVVFAVIFGLFCQWQDPGHKLTPAELDGYLAKIEAGAQMPAAEKASLLAHLRAWGEADDGGPVYMYNLMRYHDAVRQPPGLPVVGETPEEVNAYYEEKAMAVMLSSGSYPVLSNLPQGVRSAAFDSTNLIDYREALDHWDRLLVVRYTSRRAFLELISDPRYLKVMPYKFAAVEVALVPTSAEVLIPDLRFVLGSILLTLFLLVGWVRSARGGRSSP